MIKGRWVTFLDGDFHREFPEPGRLSYQDADGKWFVQEHGPRYCNTIEVTEFDAVGEAWLQAHVIPPPPAR